LIKGPPSMAASESGGVWHRLTRHSRNLPGWMWLGRFVNAQNVICNSHIGESFIMEYICGRNGTGDIQFDSKVLNIKGVTIRLS
jgi:hypothetical protein